MAGQHTRDTISFASAASYSTGVNIEGAHVVLFELPATGTLFATKTAGFNVQICKSSAGTYRTVYAATESVSGISAWELSASSGEFVVECRPAAGANYVRLKALTAATDGYTPYVHTFQGLL